MLKPSLLQSPRSVHSSDTRQAPARWFAKQFTWYLRLAVTQYFSNPAVFGRKRIVEICAWGHDLLKRFRIYPIWLPDWPTYQLSGDLDAGLMLVDDFCYFELALWNGWAHYRWLWGTYMGYPRALNDENCRTLKNVVYFEKCRRLRTETSTTLDVTPLSWMFSPICIERKLRKHANATTYRPRG